MLSNPLLSRSEFFQHLADGFGLSEEAVMSKTRFLSELTVKLQDSLRNGSQTALIVDEAHALPHEILEEIRLLANIETDDEKLLPVVLAGQPELRDRLNEPGLRQLKQRVALRCSLGSITWSSDMDRAEKIAAAECCRRRSGATVPFTPEAVELNPSVRAGLPRTINVICDNALVSGFARDERPIGGTRFWMFVETSIWRSRSRSRISDRQQNVAAADVSRGERGGEAVRSQWEPNPKPEPVPANRRRDSRNSARSSFDLTRASETTFNPMSRIADA
jgi:hypothetical protein